MSSSSSHPENAAPSAPLALPLRAAPVAEAEAVPEHADDKVSGQTAQHDATPVQPVQRAGLTPPVRARDLDYDSGKDDIKNRGSGHSQRQAAGPSLLSQALASARGITKTSKTSNSSSSNSSSSLQHDNSNNSNQTSSKNSYNTSKGQHHEAAAGARPTTSQSNGHPRTAERERNTSNPTLRTANRSTNVNDGEHQASLGRNSAQSTPAMATTATLPIAPVVSALPPRDPASVSTVRSHPFKQPSLAHAREVLMEHRDFLDRAYGRASTSLELDRSASDSLKSRAFSLSASPEESTTPTETSYLGRSEALTSSSSNNDAARDPNSRLRTRPTLEQKMTISPEKTEKIWSIGSGDGNDEDGLVEKSVAEAMAGVEHNARSRKASYSLRFFKEALPPEDKPRRKEKDKDKDKESTTTARDWHSPTVEEGSSQATHTTAKSIQQPSTTGAPKDRIDLSHSSHHASIGYLNLDKTAPAAGDKTTVASPSKLRLESHEDNLTTRHAQPPSDVGPTPASGAESVEGQRKRSPDGGNDRVATNTSTGVGVEATARHDRAAGSAKSQAGADAKKTEANVDVRPDADAEAGADGEADTEDADESGEENISSAVFLPHQEVPEARATAIDILGQSQTPRPRSISHSSSHPWLVKADEPEPEPELHEKDDEDRTPVEPSPLRPREIIVSRVTEPRRKQADDAVVVEEPDVKSQTLFNAAPVTEAQHEDYLHSQQQAQTPEPLEAIELIPYKHQVGGHTTLWRFSRRAVCKQLNNRENEFYETIELYHRDLLPFLPRYVLPSQTLGSRTRCSSFSAIGCTACFVKL